MTLFYFLRHAESSANSRGILAGRLSDVALSKAGKAQARALVQPLSQEKFDLVLSSPLQRCLETIDPFASERRFKVIEDDSFIEMDYGIWSGRKLNSLRRERLWKSIQRSPERVTFPNGESFKEAQLRIKRGLNRLSKKYPKGKILIVSHGDPIKIAATLASKNELNNFQRIVIDPASLTILTWPDSAIVALNLKISAATKSSSSKSSSRMNSRRVLGGGTNVKNRL